MLLGQSFASSAEEGEVYRTLTGSKSVLSVLVSSSTYAGPVERLADISAAGEVRSSDLRHTHWEWEVAGYAHTRSHSWAAAAADRRSYR